MSASYKTIVVHLDGGGRCAERLDVACGLGARFDAHLVGLYAPPELSLPSYPHAAAAVVLQAYERRVEEAAAEAKRMLEAAATRHGVRGEWRQSKRFAAEAVALSARYADLVVIGQYEPGTRDMAAVPRHFPGEVLLTCGRPVLVVPYAGRFGPVGKRVLVAWNASREAARAVTHALPLLQAAESVEVVAFDPERAGDDHGDIAGADIALYLARHRVKASAARQQAAIDVGAQILSRAADTGADLLVMGGYGHSRARELALGGATRSLLECMTLPVMMSH
jgi:nucleotide-binding universal stress UspA family protein